MALIQASRRGFLTGLLASVAAPALPKVAQDDPTNIFAMMERALEERSSMHAFLEGMVQRETHRLMYGDPDADPLEFQCFVPFYSTRTT